ncbi:DUF2690 domain-containing protein [Streptomyces sp. NPDC005805]|uniref:DUF2690 domain-containing protein n=1 Tax=Streptomyces sp. NPDC005805 TaxID=3157068 RepID=UPI003408B843
MTGRQPPPGTGARGAGPGEVAAARRAVPPLRLWVRPVVAGLLLGAAVSVAVTVPGRPSGGEPRRAADTPPGCRGADCTGKDPETQGCTDAGHEPGTAAEGDLPGRARMDLRHSKGCAAVWARVWLADVGTRITVRSPGGDVQEAVVQDRYDAQGYVYTPMLGGLPSDGFEACYFAPRSPGSPVCFTAPR